MTVRRTGSCRTFVPFDRTDFVDTRVWRVAWLGHTLFDHTPQLRYFVRQSDAASLVERLTDAEWIVTDEVGVLCAEDWPPQVGDYPLEGDSWPWELLELDDFNREAVER